MGYERILPNIQPVTIDTAVKQYNGSILKMIKIGRNFVTCEQSLMFLKYSTFTLATKMFQIQSSSIPDHLTGHQSFYDNDRKPC